jgi:hypothetical protein
MSASTGTSSAVAAPRARLLEVFRIAASDERAAAIGPASPTKEERPRGVAPHLAAASPRLALPCLEVKHLGSVCQLAASKASPRAVGLLLHFGPKAAG